MSALLLSEFRKVRTTKLWWIMLICIFVLAAGYSVVPAILPILTPELDRTAAFSDPGTLKSIYNGGNSIARILALVVGIMSMGGEYRHKTLAVTYLATPKRIKVISAKMIALVGFGLLYGVASVLAGVLASVPFVLINDGDFHFTDSGVPGSLALGAASIALWVLIGMGIGILVPNMIVAMLVGIGFAYLLEPLLSVLFFFKKWDIALNLMPTGATNSMLGVTSQALMASPDPFAWWQGLLVLLGWAAVPTVLGVILTLRKDVH